MGFKPRPRTRLRRGETVVFVGYDAEEMSCTPGYNGAFVRGDVLEIIEFDDDGKHLCTARRVSDGHVDAVWPNEVRTK